MLKRFMRIIHGRPGPAGAVWVACPHCSSLNCIARGSPTPCQQCAGLLDTRLYPCDCGSPACDNPAQQTFDPALLRRARRALGLSQSQLAQLLGVTRNTLSRWERGEVQPSAPGTLFLALERLGWRPEEEQQDLP